MPAPDLKNYYRSYLNDYGNLGPTGTGYQTGSALDGTLSSFSDALQTLDPNGGIGSNWMQLTKAAGGGTKICSAVATIGISSKDSSNALIWTLAGDINPSVNWPVVAIPIPCYLGIYGKNQFSQCTMIQSVSAFPNGSIRAGLGVLLDGSFGNGFNGYIFGILTDDKSWVLQRGNAGAFVTLTSGSGLADGDIFRLSADLSISTQVTLTLSRNSNILSTYIDTSGSRLIIGSPGLVVNQTTQGSGLAKSDWRTFSCGTGL